MKLCFEVNQAECFRRGIDCPEPLVTIEVNPADLDQQTRNLIADRLWLENVHHLRPTPFGGVRERDEDGEPWRIMANEPTLQGLIEAILEDEKELHTS
jgi:hypothetical protein